MMDKSRIRLLHSRHSIDFSHIHTRNIYYMFIY